MPYKNKADHAANMRKWRAQKRFEVPTRKGPNPPEMQAQKPSQVHLSNPSPSHPNQENAAAIMLANILQMARKVAKPLAVGDLPLVLAQSGE